MDNKKKKIKDLYDVILSLENEQECADFFADLCTDKEIEKMAGPCLRRKTAFGRRYLQRGN